MQRAPLQTLTFRSPDETTAFATALAPLLRPGDTILLHGPIGAGKSHFARGLIRARLEALDILDEIPSPTFTLVQTYDAGGVEIWHADLYRLAGPADIDELGLWEAFDTAICLVEWPDRLGDFAPADALSVRLSPTGQRGCRRAEFSASNLEWRARLDRAGAGHAD